MDISNYLFCLQSHMAVYFRWQTGTLVSTRLLQFLEFLRQRVHNNKVKQETLKTTKTTKGRNERNARQLIRMSLKQPQDVIESSSKELALINQKQRKVRVSFAKDCMDRIIKNKSGVTLSDESNFQLCPTPGRLTDNWRILQITVCLTRWETRQCICHNGSLSAKLEIRQICFCDRCMNQARV